MLVVEHALRLGEGGTLQEGKQHGPTVGARTIAEVPLHTLQVDPDGHRLNFAGPPADVTERGTHSRHRNPTTCPICEVACSRSPEQITRSIASSGAPNPGQRTSKFPLQLLHLQYTASSSKRTAISCLTSSLETNSSFASTQTHPVVQRVRGAVARFARAATSSPPWYPCWPDVSSHRGSFLRKVDSVPQYIRDLTMYQVHAKLARSRSSQASLSSHKE